MSDQEVTFPSGDLRLADALTTADTREPGPAALLVAGSGPIDRNSDAKRLPLGITGQIAEHLAASGFASLRYDKRGVAASDGDYLSAGFSDNVADAAAALEFLKEQPGVDPERVFVIGHSEGALIALALAASETPPAGVVLLSGAARTGEEVLRWQASHVSDLLPGPVRGLNNLLRIDVERSQIKRLEKIKASTGDVIRMQGVVKVNGKWFREFMAFDPADALSAAAVPILAITGSEDVQVDPADVAAMEQLTDAPFEGHVIPGVNHILRTGAASPTAYKKQVADPVDPRVLDLVDDWLGRYGRVILS